MMDPDTAVFFAIMIGAVILWIATLFSFFINVLMIATLPKAAQMLLHSVLAPFCAGLAALSLVRGHLVGNLVFNAALTNTSWTWVIPFLSITAVPLLVIVHFIWLLLTSSNQLHRWRTSP